MQLERVFENRFNTHKTAGSRSLGHETVSRLTEQNKYARRGKQANHEHDRGRPISEQSSKLKKVNRTQLITFVLVCRGVIETWRLASLTAEHAEQIRTDFVVATLLGRVTLGASLHEDLLALLGVSGWNIRHLD